MHCRGSQWISVLWDETYTKIAEAIDDQVVDEKLLDQAVRRVLSVKFLLGLFEQLI